MIHGHGSGHQLSTYLLFHIQTADRVDSEYAMQHSDFSLLNQYFSVGLVLPVGPMLCNGSIVFDYCRADTLCRRHTCAFCTLYVSR